MDLSDSGYGQVAHLFERGKDLRVPYNGGNFSTNKGTISFSRRILLHGICFFKIVDMLQNGTTKIRGYYYGILLHFEGFIICRSMLILSLLPLLVITSTFIECTRNTFKQQTLHSRPTTYVQC